MLASGRGCLEQGRRQQDMLPLRACIRSGLYDDFWRQRRGPSPPAAERLAH